MSPWKMPVKLSFFSTRSAVFTVMVTAALAFLLFLSVTVRVTGKVPVSVGVPVICACAPSAGDRLMPSGSVPEVSAHL